MSDRRAILLCAGLGTRARGVTAGVPKCLIRIGEETLISRAIRQLANIGVTDIHVIVGYASEQIASDVGDTATLHHFEEYARTNNLWTLASQADLLRDRDCAVMFGDVIVSDAAMGSLWASKADIAILVDSQSRLDGTMRVKRRSGGRVEMGNQITPADSDGNYVGYLRVKGAAANALADVIGCVRREERGRADYFTTVISGLSTSFLVQLVDVHNEEWAEIDTAEDFAIARDRFSPASVLLRSRA